MILNISKKLPMLKSLTLKNISYRNFSRHLTRMRFIQFLRKNDPVVQIGVLSEDGQSFAQISHTYCGSNAMVKFIDKFTSMDDLKSKLDEMPMEKISHIEILPPVTKPEKIVCIGLNYLDHCKEQGKEAPTEPMFFSKFASSLVGPQGNIIAHPITDKIDWEVELAVIIGKKAKNVPRENAFEYVFGYSIAQDISARDWQKERNGGQFLIGKTMDSFCPLGPAIVHKSLIKNPHDLNISCKVNGRTKQDSNTKNLIFKIDDIIYHLTQSMTLKPGDVILTGTPGGVGMGRNPPEYLSVGDVVESSIEGLGIIKNKVVKADE